MLAVPPTLRKSTKHNKSPVCWDHSTRICDEHVPPSADELTLQGPVFTQEPSNIVFPLDSEDRTLRLVCEAQGHPKPATRWRVNGTLLDEAQDYRYRVLDRSLIINTPDRDRDVGIFQCEATNMVGTILSREANLQFALPTITWRRADGKSISRKVRRHRSSGVLEIPNFQQEDAGPYECVAENTRGKNMGRLQIEHGSLTIASVNSSDSGMYQCLAENKHGTIYSSAELRVIAVGPDFSGVFVRRVTLGKVGGFVLIECKPRASPKPAITWRRGRDLVRPNPRVSVLDDGSLKIANLTKADAGSYTCTASNHFGTASSTGTLVVKDPTQVLVPPSSMDVTVGESIVLPCQVSHDHSLDISFSWVFNGQLIDFQKDGEHFERVGGQDSAGDLMIRSIQLKHAGKYICLVHTSVDKLSAGADLIVRGPPGPPDALTVEEITDTTAQLSWMPGVDNHSPITMYVVQARTPFSVGWQAVSTVPEVVDGRSFTATVVGLSPWVEYEFRVIAINQIGIGEPSPPSDKRRTEEALLECAKLVCDRKKIEKSEPAQRRKMTLIRFKDNNNIQQ
ncbi:hypothetical protein AB205_0145400 [Aquarana catesbeiana]|uniref:Contactin-4 n=1 Tax=Aquarana catesbeiana TaxID=8400 RepID=A0A2G9RPF8_AQUCT|nr:hypothetical protein AB205_0145400 [Aquarana catesbeiana]